MHVCVVLCGLCQIALHKEKQQILKSHKENTIAVHNNMG